jgi:hypothetical protein
MPAMLMGGLLGGPSLLNATTDPKLPLAGIVTEAGVADPEESVFDHSFKPFAVPRWRRYFA